MANKLILGILFLFLIFRGFMSFDPDFGWHLRMGEIINLKGVPMTDPFSYTMPSFGFIDHEWLSNLVIYGVDKIGGYLGLAMLFSFICTVAIGLTLPTDNKSHLDRWIETILIWAIAIILPFEGIRTQVISWLLTAIWGRLFLNKVNYPKYRWLAPLLMVLWANLHGSFPVGLVILTFIVGERWIKRRADKTDIAILGISFLATGINPYGPRLWLEIYRQVTDFSLKSRIVEWVPSFLAMQLHFFILAAFGCLVVYRYQRQLGWSTVLTFGFFLFQAIASQRHVPLWTIIAIPIVITGLRLFVLEIEVIKGAVKRFQVAGNYALKLAIIAMLVQVGLFLKPLFFGPSVYSYPDQAVNFLKEKNYGGEILANYNWGGYLIYYLPEKKVFIDGRMPSWRRTDAPTGESNDAMKEYIEARSSAAGFNTIINKYPIEVVLWPVLQPADIWDKLLADKNKPKFNLITELEAQHWQRVYRDEVAVIYVRGNN